MIEQQVSTSAGTVSFWEEGAGRNTLLMLHGNSGSKHAFVAQFGGCFPDWRLIAVDLIGHGASSNAINPERDYTIAGHADYLGELAAALALGNVVVLGVSLGGHIALELISRLASPVACMIVGSPPFSKDTASLAAAFLPGPAILLSGKAELSEEEVELYCDLHGLGPQIDRRPLLAAIRRADGTARQTMVANLLTEAAADQRQLAEGLPVPLATVVGDADQAVRMEFFEPSMIRGHMKDRQFRIAGAGHAPQLSHSKPFNEILLSFLAANLPTTNALA